MPVILRGDAYDAWLDPATAVDDAKALLSQNLAGELVFHRVGRAVNSYKYQDADAVEAIGDGGPAKA